MCVPPSHSRPCHRLGLQDFLSCLLRPGRYQPGRDQGVRETVVEGPSDCLSRKGVERSFQPFSCLYPPHLSTGSSAIL